MLFALHYLVIEMMIDLADYLVLHGHHSIRDKDRREDKSKNRVMAVCRAVARLRAWYKLIDTSRFHNRRNQNDDDAIQ